MKMRLLILCVDGFDPDYARENGFDRLPYSRKLTIPRECYVETPSGPTPHTVRVWPAMFSGKAIDYGLTRRGPLRQFIHDQLVKARITWSGRPAYRLAPSNEELETVFHEYTSFLWNIPTLSPEWITEFPTREKFLAYCLREYMQFYILARGLPDYPLDIGAVYTRIMDAWGHNKSESDLVFFYEEVSDLAVRLSRGYDVDVLLVSDHGCLDGVHTDHAYAGASFPFEAESVLDIRRVIEEKLGSRTVDARGKERPEELTEEEKRLIEKRLRGLGYIG